MKNDLKMVRTYRLTDKTVEQLTILSRFYIRSLSEQIDWMVQEATRTMETEIENRIKNSLTKDDILLLKDLLKNHSELFNKISTKS